MKDTELNESLLKKIGWHCDGMKVRYWTRPDGFIEDAPDLIHDLSACFKWLVPELYKRGINQIQFIYETVIIEPNVWVYLNKGNKYEGVAPKDFPAKALCLAANKFLR